MATEQRLIDANALKEQIIKEIHHYWNNGDGGYYLAEDVIPDIDNAPSVDAVEVVRCKDCKHYELPDDGDFLGVCENKMLPVSSGSEVYPEKDFFCSYGERREGE